MDESFAVEGISNFRYNSEAFVPDYFFVEYFLKLLF
jgi:hypothetical protein